MKRYGRYMIMLVLFMLVGYLLFYLTYENVKKEMIESLNQRQMIHARQAAIGIETFFNDHVRRLEYLAKNEHIAVLDQTGIGLMRDYHLAHQEEVSIISRIDREGRILHPEPYNAAVVRQPVTSMDDFSEAKRTGKIVVSDVFTNRRGFKTILVHAPIFRKGSFDGTLALLLPFDFIAKRYVEDIRIGWGGYAWVISKGGIELCCPLPSHVGKSVFDNCRKFPDILAMAERMTKGEQGVATYLYDHIRGDIVDNKKKQSVFLPIHLGNNFWSIAIATPEQEALSALDGFRNRLILIAVLFVIGIGFFFYMLFKARILVEEVERRKKTEEALQAKTEELDKYFTSSLDLLCIADTDAYFRRLNPEWEKTLGYALSELEGKRLLDFVHPDDVESTLKAVGELAQAKEVLNFVNRYRHKNGSYRWIEWRAYPVEKRIYAVARDITERIRVEKEMAVIAEIGRVIGSSLDIEEVYERCAVETRKLILFDRLNVNLINPLQNTVIIAYVYGTDIPDRRPGNSVPLAGSLTEAVIRLRRGLIITDLENPEEASGQYPALLPSFRVGMRSFVSVPLIARDEIIGVLHFRTEQHNAYHERDLRVAERIG
ncbi:MAG: PAS domain-containing protein, partial [Syntrophales bacterium]|nr:PAS domain-containing protein [Syntrophales bacterium]